MELRNFAPYIGGAVLLNTIRRRHQSSSYLRDKVVLITGGSKGLGLVLADNLIKEDCKIAICARDENELKDAAEFLKMHDGEVFQSVCDVAEKDQVERFVAEVTERFGRIDVVINNAGIIMVGAFESFTEIEFNKAMDVMYWGIVNTTLAVMPQMKERKEGHIVNITSVGGKVSLPHLLPYSASKFAAVGFSEGLSAELKKDNIHVTTIVPGLMRTGSYINALYLRGNKNAFKMFSAISSMPLITISAEKAARGIIDAIKKQRSLKVLGLPAKALIELHHFFPETVISMFGLVSRYLPSSIDRKEFERGEQIMKRSVNPEIPGLREIGHKAQREHQLKDIH